MNQSSLNTNEKIQLMNEFKNTVLNYFKRQVEILEEGKAALRPAPIDDNDTKIKQMKLQQYIEYDKEIANLKKHIAVIEAMFPFNAGHNGETKE